VRAPYVPLTNVRIDRRHAHSVALAAFFRRHFEATGQVFRKAGEFFLAPEGSDMVPVDMVKSFLTPVPSYVRDSLRRVLPESVASAIGVETDAWVDDLVRLLDNARDELAGDVAVLEGLQLQAAQEAKYTLAKRYQMVAQTLVKRD